MNTDIMVEKVMHSVPGCVAAGIIDLESGQLSSSRGGNDEDVDILENVATAASEAFTGQAQEHVIEVLNDRAGDTQRTLQEFLIFSEKFIHILFRPSDDTNHILIVAAAAGANIGMILAKSRLIIVA